MARDSCQTKQKSPSVAENAQGAPAGGIAMFDPGNRDFRDVKTGFLCEKQELGIEHPSRLATQRKKRPRRGRGDRLESALRVRDRKSQHETLEKSVEPRREFAMRATRDARARDEPRPAHDVRISVLNKSDHRRHDRKIRREIRVREQENVRVFQMAFPRLANREAFST